MFGFLTSLLGSSLSTHIIELIFQLILFYAIYKLGDTKSKIWRVICQRLSLFLILETFVRFVIGLNSLYFLLAVPIVFKIVIALIVALPLIKLWLELPILLLEYNKDRKAYISIIEPNKIEEQTAGPVVNFQATQRLLNSLQIIDQTR